MDFFNCGRCGKRCRFGEMCCGGGCVNVFYDPNNCGFCGNRCKPGGFCRYGMCDYAS
ncbi:Stigma-specific protein, Stig1 [Musa troglodytarum]|nr:Stigma-specific protein, Stig1 [Musa troglodytarum]